mmetsp:Transcript_9455/g.14177  ORF Transcript_9455/g.14177 Transcript_9455/m.14177 type:complete len:80 (-) Transcript_9455:290-529(-)
MRAHLLLGEPREVVCGTQGGHIVEEAGLRLPLPPQGDHHHRLKTVPTAKNQMLIILFDKTILASTEKVVVKPTGKQIML